MKVRDGVIFIFVIYDVLPKGRAGVEAIDTVYVGLDFFDHSIIVKDFKVVGGE